MTRPSNTLSALRQLAAQGVSLESAWPALQAILDKLAPYSGLVAGRVDVGGNPTASLTTGGMVEVNWQRYFTHYFNGREAQAYPPFRRFLFSGLAMDRYHQNLDAMLRSDVWNDVLQVSGARSGLRIAIGEPGSRVGKVSIFRPEAKGFSPAEERALLAAVPYLTHLWNVPANPRVEVTREAESGAWLLADKRGRIHFLSGKALELLHLAADVPQTNPWLADAGYGWARPLLSRLAGMLADLESGRPAPPPIIEVRNRAGLFRLRAWRMAAIADGSGYLGVQIDRHLPLAMRLLASPLALSFSPRERDVLLALAAGFNREETAKRLHIGVSSVVTHVRSLYDRVGVSRRDELVGAVLASGRQEEERSFG
jgi:DNA-binding CsgD family transcriptional regulator